jgi:hypothetical protein
MPKWHLLLRVLSPQFFIAFAGTCGSYLIATVENFSSSRKCKEAPNAKKTFSMQVLTPGPDRLAALGTRSTHLPFSDRDPVRRQWSVDSVPYVAS